MRKVNYPEQAGEDPAVPATPSGWLGYVFVLAGIAAAACTLVAFAYGFVGWGLIGIVCVVVLFGVGGVLVTRAGKHNLRHYLTPDREA